MTLPDQDLSASSLSHAETPLGLAFLTYSAFSCGVQRNRTTSVAGVLMGGLPFGFLGWSMPRIMWLQIILDKGATWVFNVATLNQEAAMETKYTDLKKAMAWYNALTKAGFSATLETLVPCKEWRVVVIK